MTDTIRVHTIGIGENCDKELCKEIAKAGRGTCSLIRDMHSNLNATVIRALNYAMYPSAKDFKFKWAERDPE